MSSFLTGKVSERTVYTPVPAGRYRFLVVDAEVVDPISKGWLEGKTIPSTQRAFREAPFGRMRCQLVGDAVGTPVAQSGRIIDCRVPLLPGVNPTTGRSDLEMMADLIRIRERLTRKEETLGKVLFEAEDLDGLVAAGEREAAVAEASRRFRQAVLNLDFVGIVSVKEVKGEQTDRIVKIVVTK